MPRPDEGLIHEWLDGELSPDEAARVEGLVRTDAEWGAAAAEARGLVAAASRILGALDTVAGDVIPAGSQASGANPAVRTKPVARFTVRPWMRAAAGIAIVVTGTMLVVRGSPDATDQLLTSATAPASEMTEAKVATDSAPPAASPATPTATQPTGARQDAPRNAVRQESARSADAIAAGAGAAVTNIAPPPVPAPAAQVQAQAEAQVQALADSRDARDAREREARTAPERILPSPNSIALGAQRRGAANAVAGSVAGGVAAPSAAKALATPTLEGCWRAASTVPRDTLLRALPIIRSQGDTLELRLDAAGRVATVVRDGDVLRGTVRAGAIRELDALTRTAPTPWRAERRECPD